MRIGLDREFSHQRRVNADPSCIIPSGSPEGPTQLRPSSPQALSPQARYQPQTLRVTDSLCHLRKPSWPMDRATYARLLPLGSPPHCSGWEYGLGLGGPGFSWLWPLTGRVPSATWASVSWSVKFSRIANHAKQNPGSWRGGRGELCGFYSCSIQI